MRQKYIISPLTARRKNSPCRQVIVRWIPRMMDYHHVGQTPRLKTAVVDFKIEIIDFNALHILFIIQCIIERLFLGFLLSAL